MSISPDNPGSESTLGKLGEKCGLGPRLFVVYRGLLGHSDVKTAMIYTHVLNRGPAGVRSPVDGL